MESGNRQNQWCFAGIWEVLSPIYYGQDYPPILRLGDDCENTEGKQFYRLGDLSRSPIIKRAPYVPGGGNPEVYKGFYFDEAAWDGSSIFRVHPSDKIMTRAVKDAFTNAKIRNVKFIALPDEETDTIIYRKYKEKQE